MSVNWDNTRDIMVKKTWFDNTIDLIAFVKFVIVDEQYFVEKNKSRTCLYCENLQIQRPKASPQSLPRPMTCFGLRQLNRRL